MDQNQDKDVGRCNGTNFSDTLPWHVPRIGRVHIWDFYEPDSLNNHHTELFEVSFSHAIFCSKEQQAACYFGSALCAVCPTLTTAVKKALEEHGIQLSVIKLPSEADDEVVLDHIYNYDPIEIFTLVGSCLMMIFKDESQVICDNFTKMTVTYLAQKLGMPDVRKAVFWTFFQTPHAKAVYNVFGTSISLKGELMKFLMYLSKREDKIALMARCVLELTRNNKWSN